MYRVKSSKSSELEAASTCSTASLSALLNEAKRIFSSDHGALLLMLLCEGGLDKASSLITDAMSLSLGIRVRLDPAFNSSGVDWRLANVTRV